MTCSVPPKRKTTLVNDWYFTHIHLCTRWVADKIMAYGIRKQKEKCGLMIEYLGTQRKQQFSKLKIFFEQGTCILRKLNNKKI